jgi:hypothetical protein
MNIHNIHVMRKSFLSVMDLCQSSLGFDANWLSKLEGTSWLEHIRNILVCSSYCIEIIEKENSSVLLHCSDGWDRYFFYFNLRTSQVCSLVELCLDPFYRTIEGKKLFFLNKKGKKN